MSNIKTSLFGKLVGLTHTNRLVTSDGLVVGNNQASDLLMPAPNNRAFFDRFMGDVIADQWSAAKGTDGQAVIATVKGGAGGGVRLTSGDTTVVAESLSSLTYALNWTASQTGGLIMEAKVTPVSAVTTVAYFVGLTDTLATSTLEEPMTLSGTTFTTTATDAVGFLYDTNATTDVFYGMSVAGDTDGAAAVPCSLPVAGTAVTLRVELDTSGNAKFYENGVYKGAIATAVTAATALTPIVSVMARTTACRSIDVDYIYVGHR